MSVVNGKEAEITRGSRTNGILFDHDDDKTFGSLNTKGAEELGLGEVSKEFASRNRGLRGIRARANAAAEENRNVENDAKKMGALNLNDVGGEPV